MADKGIATFIPTSTPHLVTDYDPIVRGSGGGEPVEPKRWLMVDGELVAIQ